MKNVYKFCVLLLMVVAAGEARAQQDPLYGLYMNNPMVINPAYVGSTNNLQAFAGYRMQWSGFDGNPTTVSAGGQVALRDNKVGAGVLVVQDRIGENTNTNLNGMFSYKLKLKESSLSFGMQAGLINYGIDASKLTIQDPGDPAFGTVNQMKFNLGAGAMLKSERFMVGLSVPRLVNNAVSLGGQEVKLYQQHLYLYGGYVFHMSNRIQLKPTVLLKGVKGTPMSADVNMNVLIDQKYVVGVFTRNLNAYGWLAQINFMERYRLAYALEIPTNKSVGTRFTTHEIQIGLRLAPFSYHDKGLSNF